MNQKRIFFYEENLPLLLFLPTTSTIFDIENLLIVESCPFLKQKEDYRK